MKLRLLSSEFDDLVDPDDKAIGKALAKLPDISGDTVPRAVLEHGNGSDFIQFFAMEEMGEKWEEHRSTPCHIQYCSSKPKELDHFFSEDADFEQVIKIFKLYGKRGQEWKREVNWEPYTPKRRIMDLVKGFGCAAPLFLLGLLFLFSGGLMDRESGVIATLGCLLMGGYLLWLYLAPPARGLPWTSSSADTSSGGGGCSSGGGGDGGGGGCGGCGGGGGE